ncbi:MAG: hybrid sensor histidine kinase/response regulator, partial [Verrucomicrobiales bacterium 32-60-5]
MLDKARDAILVRHFEHGITYWNKSAELLYGWTAEEVIGRQTGDLLYRDLAAYEQAIAEVLGHGEWTGELQQITKSGAFILIEARWTLVRDDAGRPQGVLAINSDITDKKKMEQQFLRAQRMESIGTLAGGIAHDLNNVLAPILMSIELLRMTSRDERARAVLSTIETSAKRGADMVKQILSFARGVEGERMVINIRHIIQDMQHLVQDTFPKEIVFRAELDKELPLFSGDHTQVHQVLLNLCVNARDAMPTGGTLTVSATSLQVDDNYAAMTPGSIPGRYLKIKVTDTGIGIPPEVVDKIFDPFFTTKELGKGTGLGLSTVLSIVKSHGGFLNVYSEPGNGTTFSVCFPAMDAPEGEVAKVQADTHPRGNGEMILIVDDEAAVRTITQQTLETYGYRVLTAADGTEAVALYSMHRMEIAAVVTDMMMPVMGGQATIQVL